MIACVEGRSNRRALRVVFEDARELDEHTKSRNRFRKSRACWIQSSEAYRTFKTHTLAFYNLLHEKGSCLKARSVIVVILTQRRHEGNVTHRSPMIDPKLGLA